MMTKSLKNAAVWIVGLCVCWTANAEMPLKPTTAKQVQELTKISPLIIQKIELEEPQWIVVEEAANSEDDLTLAIATLLLHRINTVRSQELLAKISQREIKPGSLTESVLKTERLAAELASTPITTRVDPWVKAASDPNPYIQITAAKVLCELDPKAAKTTLIKIEKEAPMLNPTANRLRRDLASQLGEEVPPPIPGADPTYFWYEQSTKALPITLKEPLGPPQPNPIPQLPAPKEVAPEDIKIVFANTAAMQKLWEYGAFKPNTFYWTNTEETPDAGPKGVTEENKPCLLIEGPQSPTQTITVIRAYPVPPNKTKATITATAKTNFNTWAGIPKGFGINFTLLNQGKIQGLDSPILTDKESPTWKTVSAVTHLPEHTQQLIITMKAGPGGRIHLAWISVEFE